WKYTDAEGDALAARLQAAEAKIADLEKQLRDCLNRKPEVIEKDDAPLATIYYPIGKSTITGVNTKIVNAVAEVMKQSDKNYVLTGWADNYTGTDKINAKLRKDRVNGVKKALVRKGVAADRLDAQINDGNLTNFGAKCASLDRAVTINEAK
ncbi:MAG: OmpA family protein, partial [Muribaculaceae bacterium]